MRLRAIAHCKIKTRGFLRAFQILDVDLLGFDRQLDVDRLFFLAQSPAQLRERDILQLTNTFAGHTKFFANFLERFRLSTVESETLEDDFLLAVVEHVEQSADFVAQVFIAQQLEWRLRFLVADDLAKLG